jgi:hypothetical protein
MHRAEGHQDTETPESETLAYLEALERRATLRKIRRKQTVPDEAQREGDEE